jgi:Flp pilus assembly protein TadG
MSDVRMMDGHGGAADAKGTAALAMALWVVVIVALAYGAIETFQKVVELF